MRRTDEEFKAEVLRRSEAYRVRRKKRVRRTALVCLPVLICWLGLAALVTGGFQGYGASVESAVFDANLNGTCAEAPAAVEDQAVSQAEPEEGALEYSSGSGCNAEVLSVEVISQPEYADHARYFVAPEQVYTIVDAIQEFLDSPSTVIGGDEVEDYTGMCYRITVTEEALVREYTLLNNALLNTDGIWYVNADCYEALVKLIRQPAETSLLPEDFNIRFTWAIGAENVYDTYGGLLQKDLVLDGAASAEFEPDREVLAQIYGKLQELDIAAIDRVMTSAVLTDTEEAVAMEPLTVYTIRFTMNGQTYTVEGDATASCYPEDADAAHFTEFVSFMCRIAQNTPEFRELPEANGGYD